MQREILQKDLFASIEKMTSRTADDPTVYFGYGSNLWLHQMNIRCPTSKYLGVARLNAYRWMINDRGYANVVETSEAPEVEKGSDVPITNVSYGLVFSLQKDDERQLDRNEGVPIAYVKEYISVDFWPASASGKAIDVRSKPRRLDMLVYINRKRVEDDQPKKEYIYRMNMGIKDAIKQGVPEAYVERSMRQFIPEKDEEGIEAIARKQALEFEDEN